MPRLIDADALMKYTQNQILKSIDCNDIARFPLFDAVPVVRCKDCKYGESSVNALGESSCCCNNPDIGFYGWLLDEDDFCSYGERKDDAVCEH